MIATQFDEMSGENLHQNCLQKSIALVNELMSEMDGESQEDLNEKLKLLLSQLGDITIEHESMLSSIDALKKEHAMEVLRERGKNREITEMLEKATALEKELVNKNVSLVMKLTEVAPGIDLSLETKRTSGDVISEYGNLKQECKRLTKLVSSWKDVAERTEKQLEKVKKLSKEKAKAMEDEKKELRSELYEVSSSKRKLSEAIEELEMENSELNDQLAAAVNTSTRKLFNFTAACVAKNKGFDSPSSLANMDQIYQKMMENKIPPHKWYGEIKKSINKPKTNWTLRFENMAKNFIQG